MEYISVKAAARKYGVTPRWVQKLCEEGKLEGATRLEGSGVWMIPRDTTLPSPRKSACEPAQNRAYTPKPVDTEGIELPQTLIKLTEKIAENVHENWAMGRMAQGWTYGALRDGIKKTTPCLVPYSDLSEEEKEYDRVTAMQTLKLILAMGYKIEKAEPFEE